MTDPRRPFDWQDGERSIHFGRGRLAEAVRLLGGDGYTLLTTPRASAAAPGIASAASAVHEVSAGQVDELAADLLDRDVGGDRVVAVGGGRIIDVAKAVVAARRAAGDTEVRALAVPTTLSGAEMTQGHRHARGVPAGTPRVRPAVVVADPALIASQPEAELAASALNALGHAAEGPCTPKAHPVATMAAFEGARLLALAFEAGEVDRDAAALGALLSGYAIDSAGYGLHHVLSQTIVRRLGIPHASANAILLPHTLAALAWRNPECHAGLAEALGGDPVEVAARLRARTGVTSLRELGIDRDDLPRMAEAAAQREDLAMTPPAADRAEILALYEQAF
jgi:alcohol dehydrogenase class IV